MILHHLGILLGRFGNTDQGRQVAVKHSRIWRQAAAKVPELVPDLIRQGGLLEAQPVVMESGVPLQAPMDPYRLAYEAGRRDLAVQLIAAAGLSIDEVNSLMKEQDYE
ncbi:hypothetical protein CDO87_03440 [Sagittula sp. P11]|uniref:hypothetical protein n=1 Tax=Sagittula sp. P11 TaxID=2009329 RepID=UPI000C2D578C|nr:hypothetical protein [Sagittula sp. P11]AUC52299.1 hypothetical protein CDO87_03440 [Sagittula sp. P11]